MRPTETLHAGVTSWAPGVRPMASTCGKHIIQTSSFNPGNRYDRRKQTGVSFNRQRPASTNPLGVPARATGSRS